MNKFDEFKPANQWDEFSVAGPTVEAVLHNAVKDNPDQAAKAAQLAKRYPMPEDAVLRNLQDLQLQAAVDKGYEHLQKSPRLAEQLRRNPFLASQSHDDLGELSAIEKSFDRTLLGTVGDVAVTALKGAVGLPQSFVGLADLATGGYAGKGVQAIGIDFKRTQDILGELYSPAQQAANERVEEVDGFFNTLGAMVSNPSTIATTIGESLPQMLGGAAIARKLLTTGAKALGVGMTGPTLPGLMVRQFGEKYAPVIAAAIGEGTLGAGAAAENYRANDSEGLLTAKTTLASLGSGVGTGLFSLAGGAAARRMGLEDIDTALASRGLDAGTASTLQTGFIASLLKAGISEGVFEEMPQSIQEKMWQNWGEDKPLTEGVGKAAAQGVLAGFSMGGGFQAISRVQERFNGTTSAVNDAAHLQEQFSLAAGAMLRERNPEEFRSLIQSMADQTEGAPTELYVDAEVLNQLAPEILSQLPGVAEQMEAALAANSVVSIPIGDVLTIAPGTPLEQMLVEHARIGDTAAMSQAEAREAGARAQEYLAQESQRVIQQATDQAAMQASSDRVKQGVLDQLNTVGRFRQDVNDAYATWTTAFYTTMAGRTGMTPEQMAAKYPLRIVGKTGQGSTLNAAPFDVTHAATAALADPANANVVGAFNETQFAQNPDGSTSRIGRDHFESWVDSGGVTEEIGSQYDGHGIAKGNPLGALLNILENGINTSRRFDSAPLVPMASAAGSGSGLGSANGAYKDGPFILLGARGRSILDGIQTVLVSDQVAAVIPALQARFPQVRFVSHSDAQSVLSQDPASSQSPNDPNVLNQSLTTMVPSIKGAVVTPTDVSVPSLEAADQPDPKSQKALDANVNTFDNKVQEIAGKSKRGYESIKVEGDTLRERAESIIAQMVRNLRTIYAAIPESIRERSKLWYDGANRISLGMAERYGISPMQAAGQLAVTSPQADWYMNVSYVERINDILTQRQDHTWDDQMETWAEEWINSKTQVEGRAAEAARRSQAIKDALKESKAAQRAIEKATADLEKNTPKLEAKIAEAEAALAQADAEFKAAKKAKDDKATAKAEKLRDKRNDEAKAARVNLRQAKSAIGKAETVLRNADKTLQEKREYAALPDENLAIQPAIRGKQLSELTTDFERAWWVRAYDEAHNPRSYRVVTPEGAFLDFAKLDDGVSNDSIGWKSFSAISKAISIFGDGSVENVHAQLGGEHKVRNFYNNIFAPNSATPFVTSDTHQVAANLFLPLGADALEVGQNFGGTGSKSVGATGLNGTYWLYHEAVVRAAKAEGIKPREMQSISWEAIRNLFSPAFKSDADSVAAVRDLWVKYQQGAATYEDTIKDIIDLAGGKFRDPAWVGTRPDSAAAVEDGATSYESGLAHARSGQQRREQSGPGNSGNAGQNVSDGGLNGEYQQTGNGTGRSASARTAPLPGAPVIEGATGPDPRLVAVAEQYAADNGIDLKRQSDYTEVDAERGARIAAAYAEMQHAPQDPAVREAYENMIQQTLAQYRALEAAGYKFWFIDPTNDPYNSPWDAMRELRASQTLGVFPTAGGFGNAEGTSFAGNPMEADTGLMWPYGSPDGELRPVLANDLFRAVHDAFGHGLEGAGFRVQGEENAWQAHVRLFTGSAVGAITSETRGQNSWLNFGPNGEANQTAKVEETVFAEQKTGLMPEWTWTEGRTGDAAEVLNQGPRGTFNPSNMELALNENADLSTFLHETGHFFLEVMADLASQPGAPADIQSDMAELIKWFGVSDLATWNGYTLDQKRPYHERFAESFEQYLLEGKAPSLELQPLFRKFRAWMLNVYKSLKAFIDSRVPVTQGGDSLAQAAYHGTPHRGISKFSTDKIGTGEGAQAYGWGLYFASKREIAEWYRETLQQDSVEAALSRLNDGQEPKLNDENSTAGVFLRRFDGDGGRYTTPDGVAFDDVINELGGRISRKHEADGFAVYQFPDGSIIANGDGGWYPMSEPVPGQLYEVDIPEDSEMLLWDKPLDEQSDADLLREIAEQEDLQLQYRKATLHGERTGEDFYQALSQKLGSDESASRVLESYGVKGIKYLDGNSRAAGDGSFNYVVFSGDNVEIQQAFYQDPNAAPGANIQLSDEVRQVFDRMLASEEQIAEANEVAGLLPDQDADAEAIERLTARSLRDLKWTVNARAREIKKLQKQAAELRKGVEAEVRAEVEQQPVYAARNFLRTDTKLDISALEEAYTGEGDRYALLDWKPLVDQKLAGKDGAHPDLVADIFGFASGDEMVRALLSAEPIASVIQGITDQRMLEQHGDLIDQRAIEAAANEAVHNEARARSLATELKSQGEALNARTDTGQVNAKGSKVTVNAIVEAAKQFAANVISRTPLRDLKSKAQQHTAAERRAGKRWQEHTAKGETAEAIKAKQDQVLNNAAAKAAIEAQEEMRKILTFFKRVIKDNNEKTVEKGRDPDVVNAARAVLGAYGIAPKGAKTAAEYMDLVAKNDPAMFAALQPSVQGALNMAQPLDALTMDELRGLHEEIQAMWHLAKRSRQMEVDGNLIDMQDAEDELQERMQEIGVPDSMPGETSAVTTKEAAGRALQFARSLLRRAEQWSAGMGAPFTKLVFQPVKDAANRYRADRVKYRKAYQALVDKVAPFLEKGPIEAPELNYTFGKGHNGIGHAELLHAILHTGNESNKRKLLLGRKWATENADGTLDTTNWDNFIQRMWSTGVLTGDHYNFAQGVWDLLEQTKPLAQKTHRDVFGRYFAEVTADEFTTPFGTYAGGYVPAQADPRIVQDAALRDLATSENENMAFSFPGTNKGFTKGRVEYNRPLMLDLRTIGQHIDKVLLFSHMEPAVRDVNKLLSRKGVSYSLGRIDPTIYAGMLTPWLNRSARQVVETPIVGDGGVSRVLSAARGRAGMALMFANISNSLQQLTGFSTAFAKLKADGLNSHMMRATAAFIASPKQMAAAVSDASPFMASRMENEISAINDAMDAILLDPNLYEKAQAWTRKHAYFMQSAMANTMEPIIWQAGYNAALEKGQSTEQAVRYADGLIRQTQGSTLPEDVSRIETGPAYARMFTQFIGYFNMIANTNGTALKRIAEEEGLKKGAGKALMVVTMGLLIPIWIAEAIAVAMRGGPDDEDDDGYLDDWLAAVFGMGTIKGMFAMVPFVGQAANASINRFNGNPADDKMSLSPAVSLLEGAVGVPVDVYKLMTDPDRLNKRTAVRDVASAISILTGLPAVAVARPIGYLAGMSDDKIDPTSGADMARGLLTGTPSPGSK